jgi:Carboxypeptidase regulatory-like domain
MNGSGFRVLVALALLLAFWTEEARACSCGSRGVPPCEAAWKSDAVFAGTVRSIEEVDHLDGSDYRSRLVTIEVERGFINAAPGTIQLTTGMGGGDCGYRFVTGRRYVVYAWKTPTGRLSTGICSRTRPLEEAAEDVQYLGTAAQASAGARVYGRVTHWQRDPFEAQAVDYGPLENVTINVRGTAFSRDVATDRDGRYEISGLPVGTMTLTLMPPQDFDPRYLEQEIELRDLRACTARDFQLRYVARASGTVVDDTGRPLPGILVDAVAAELAGYRPPPYQHPVKTDHRGRFEFDDLPPGLYVFGVNLTKPEWTPPNYKPAGPAVFLPGTSVARDASTFDLKPSERVDVGVLRLGAH